MSVVGLLGDDVDPMVNVMKVDKAPTESYADIGGLQKQIQEVKEAVELPMTHPELYEDIGIKPPKGVIFFGPPGTGEWKLHRHGARSMPSFLWLLSIVPVLTPRLCHCRHCCVMSPPSAQARPSSPRPSPTRRARLSSAWSGRS